MVDVGRSGHPVDRLIRELIATRRPVTSEEVESILGRIATAEFDSRTVRVPNAERGVEYGNRRLLARDDSLFIHLVRRVVLVKMWSTETSPEDYVQDLRRAARAKNARLVIYARRGGSIAGIFAPTEFAVPAVRLGPESLPELFGVYSADRGTIVSGYQTLGQQELAIPSNAQWLR
ncbi:MAG: hypothetical protein K0Q71_4875 [Thermomicrobiales bacterium]|jgi:hypothetical protein|nr:hypothetical protein [Thermomicrobiales bacterium]